ncbi:MAG: thymidine kinase [Rhizobiaceae bacterium]|nr:thymidine kinase [Rhizobiaceae bacterium]
MAKLYFHYSAMNSGKSTLLLQAAHNYTERNLVPYLMKTVLDDREGEGFIGSRIGIKKPCDTFGADEDLFVKIKARTEDGPIDCVLVDEAHFMTEEQVWQLAQVVDDLDIPVMTYGLRTDFQAKLFPGSAELLAISDVLREVRTIDESGKNATMNLRIDEHGNAVTEGPQQQIGGNESYKSVSRKEWRKRMGK